MPKIKINHIDIYYELHGQGDPLVLIAGYTCDHTFWSAMLDALSKKFQVLIFDNRGIGQTEDKNASFTLENIADDLIALVKALHLAKPSILGQSMGGMIAQIIAKKYPEKINKLIILNTTGQLNDRSLKAIESFLNLQKANIHFDLLIETSMPWFFSSDYLINPKNIENFKKGLKNNPFPQSLFNQERQFTALSQFNNQLEAHTIQAPTLIIAAEEDIICIPKESEQLAKKIPHAQFLCLPGGHSSPIEQPREVNKAIIDFLTM